MTDTADVPAYEVFTTEFDDVVHISELVSEGRMAEVRREIDKYRNADDSRLVHCTETVGEAVSKLAAQFEESGIDPAETAVTFLIDGSGSTRGGPDRNMAISTIDLCAALEKIGVETAVLGYTTASFMGGESWKKWLAQGKPENPGRVCDLLHIVYKYSDETIAEASDHVAALACGETKKENIDGEALQWAAGTMDETERRHRILVNVNDGFPIDDATIWANGSADFLRAHVGEVTRSIDDKGMVAVVGVCLDAAITSDYEAFVAERQGMFPREIVVQMQHLQKSSLDTTLETVGEGVALGIRRAAELSLNHVAPFTFRR
jgi:cobalamin biosynthesis protein CobT